MKIINGLLIACLLSVMLFSISVAESFRCGSHLIEEGMQRSKVLEYCGQPTEEAGWTWHYDRGPGGFIILVHFDADGTVNRIEEQSGDGFFILRTVRKTEQNTVSTCTLQSNSGIDQSRVTKMHNNFSFKTKIGLIPVLTVLTVLIGGFATVQAADDGWPPKVSSDGMPLVEGTKAAAVWVKEGADFSEYSRVMIVDVGVGFIKNWRRDYNRDEV